MKRWIGRGLLGLLLLLGAAMALIARCDLPAEEVAARWDKPPSKYVEVDGVRVHVREQGSGPALVLLHGSSSSLFTWDGWVRELGRDHHVIALDLPGHGLTGPRADLHYGHADMAELVDHVMTAMHVDKASVAGNSMGGQVAATLAILHPERIEKLILIDATGLRRDEPRPLVFRLAGAPVIGRLFEHLTPRFLVAQNLREVYGDPSRVTDETIDRTLDMLLREGNRDASRIRLGLPVEELQPTTLQGLKMPVLILWGKKDRWVLPKYADRYHEAIPNSKLVWFDDLGHVPMEEDPVATARAARQFLDGQT